jgi:hypothetical protein
VLAEAALSLRLGPEQRSDRGELPLRLGEAQHAAAVDERLMEDEVERVGSLEHAAVERAGALPARAAQAHAGLGSAAFSDRKSTSSRMSPQVTAVTSIPYPALPVMRRLVLQPPRAGTKSA